MAQTIQTYHIFGRSFDINAPRQIFQMGIPGCLLLYRVMNLFGGSKELRSEMRVGRLRENYDSRGCDKDLSLEIFR
jgi:hypothetical protein